MIAGYAKSDNSNITSCMRFDLLTNMWEDIREIKAPGRNAHSCCYLNEKIYMFGGYDGSNYLSQI